MAKQKFYAVKRGRSTGVFRTWEECRRQVQGYSSAAYKSFGTEEEAKAYLAGTEGQRRQEQADALPAESKAEVYVDGSYCAETEEFSYGMVVLHDGAEHRFSEKMADAELAMMHNVAGEIKGAEAAMRYAIEHKLAYIVIYHDYEGIAKWCTGEWKANKPGTQAYQAYYQAAKEKVDIAFQKVRGHSNDKYNDLADELAKQALGIAF